VQEAVATILDTMPKGGGGGGGLSREEQVDRICEDLLSKVPPAFEKEETKEKLRRLPGGPTQPLTVHLRQEIDRLNIIIKLTTQTLQNLRLAIAGVCGGGGGGPAGRWALGMGMGGAPGCSLLFSGPQSCLHADQERVQGYRGQGKQLEALCTVCCMDRKWQCWLL
jgi:hypothetical protein